LIQRNGQPFGKLLEEQNIALAFEKHSQLPGVFLI
jgi:hypothetical protein